MDLGDLLGETFRVYRGSFWAFSLITLLAEIPLLIGELIPIPALSLIFILAGIVLYILAEGAIIFAVAQQYLGREIIVGECYRRAWSRFGPLLGGLIVFLIALFISALLAAIIIGIPIFFYLLVSRFFYAEAIMMEGIGPLEALGRSRDLVRGSWWRVFGIGIIFVIIIVVIGILMSIPGSIAAVFSPTAGAILLTLVGIILTPIASIGATLVYFDLRIRKEGYTLETMASEVGI